jgi:hypothetical protein
MAFGIDDALSAAAGGIKLTDTIVEIVKRYRKTDKDPDLELLIEEIRLTALRRIDEADLALAQFERTLIDAKVNIDKRLQDVIAETPFWRPFQQHRLSQFQKQFNHFSDSVYCAVDDIAALLRCQGKTAEMGKAVVQSTAHKHEMYSRLLHAKSLKESIDLLRAELARHKRELS